MNPNTGEIRGASVYMGSQWFELAYAAFGARPPAPPPPGAAADAPAERAPAPRLAWGGMSAERLCDDHLAGPAALSDSPAERAAIAMFSERERIERVITQTAAHEVGHTLGLRHNFKGSLMPPSSIVMDYMSIEGKAASPRQGPYDISAIRYLYNLSEDLPTEPFCTDGQGVADPFCTQRDYGADPLNDFHAHAFTGALDAYVTMGLQRDRTRLESAAGALMLFVRTAPAAQQRLAAWRIAMERVRVAVAPCPEPARVDLVARTVTTRLFPDPPAPVAGATAPTTPFQTPFPPDPALAQEVALELKANILATAPLRTPATRRVCVTALRRMQTVEGYRALREARAQLAATQAQTMGDEQLVVEDLIARIDKALAPYFD